MPQSKSSVPDMGAVKIPEYKCRQSRFPHAPPLALLGLAVGPSMSGKTNMLVKLITEVYRHRDGKSCFDRIYVFSPSVNHDPMWQPVRDMIENEILDMRNPNHHSENFFFDEPDFAAMEKNRRAVRDHQAQQSQEAKDGTKHFVYNRRFFSRA